MSLSHERSAVSDSRYSGFHINEVRGGGAPSPEVPPLHPGFSYLNQLKKCCKQSPMSELLQQVKRWQRAIATDLSCRDSLSLPQLNYLTQNLILSVLGLRLCEQQCLVSPGQLDRLRHKTALHQRLHELVQTVNGIYGDLLPQPGAPELAIADELLQTILTSLEKSWTTAMRSSSSKGVIAIEILGQSYECCLSQFEAIPLEANSQTPLVQKTGGSYYTPRAIVDDIIHQTLGQLPLAASPPTILDPACGGGAFLLAAYQHLLRSEMLRGETPLTYEQRQELLLNCIFGVDIDPQAIAVTRLSLQLQLLTSNSQPPHPPLPDLTHTIRCGNALIGFDWEQAFPMTAQGTAQGFDVVVGNPPYLDSEEMIAALPHWRRYCTAHYQTAVGNWDLFCVFIEKGLEVCREQGLISFVVPNKLASAAYAAQTRSLLTRDNRLIAIHDYSHIPVFSVAVYPLMFVAQKGAANAPFAIESPIAYEVMEPIGNNLAVKRSHSLPYSLYANYPDKPWVIPTPHHSGDWMVQLQDTFSPLAKMAQVTGAATVAEAYAMRSLLHDKRTIEPGDLPLVNSGTLDRYRMLWGEKPLRYLGASYWHPVIERSQTNQLPKTRRQQATQPKIIVAGMTKGLECALDATGGILAGKSTSIIRSTLDLDLRYLLGVLNSSLMQLYFVSHFGGNCLQGGYLRVGPPQLKQLPIALPSLTEDGNHEAGDRHLYQRLIALVDQQLVRSQPTRAIDPHLDHDINQLVYRLYGLTDAAIAEVEAWRTEKDKPPFYP